MTISKFLPTPQKLTQETIATLAAIVISAWIVSRIPAIRNLVRESNTQPY
jgi:Flp pilus assembly protein TadB